MERDSRQLYGRQRQARELAVFLFLIVPSLATSFFLVQLGRLEFPFIAFAVILRDLSLLSLVLYFLWINRETLASIGLTFAKAGKELLIGIWLYLPVVIMVGLLERALLAAGLSGPSERLAGLSAHKSTPEYVLASVLVMVVAVTEETIFRGYLLIRFRNVLASTTAAVIVSSIIFSLGHGYEGSAGIVVTGTIGLVFALIALWRRSLVAPIVMHFLQDFLGIVLLPLFGAR